MEELTSALRGVRRALATRSMLQGAPRPVFVPDGARERFKPPAGRCQWDALTKRSRSARSRPVRGDRQLLHRKVEAVDPERGVAEPPGPGHIPARERHEEDLLARKPEGIDGDKVAAKLAPYDDSPSARGLIELSTGCRTWVRSGAPWALGLGAWQQNLGDMPVPNSTELHHTQANIHRAAAQKIRGLSSPECVGVRPRNHLLISRLKVRFLHGSPLDRGAATPPDLFLARSLPPIPALTSVGRPCPTRP